MYEWANSPFAVIILTAVFPVYYRSLATTAGCAAEDATAYWAYTTSLSMLVVALVGPVLGRWSISVWLASILDHTGARFNRSSKLLIAPVKYGMRVALKQI